MCLVAAAANLVLQSVLLGLLFCCGQLVSQADDLDTRHYSSPGNQPWSPWITVSAPPVEVLLHTVLIPQTKIQGFDRTMHLGRRSTSASNPMALCAPTLVVVGGPLDIPN